MPPGNTTTLWAQLRALQTSAREAREAADALRNNAIDVEGKANDAITKGTADSLRQTDVDALTNQVTGIQKDIDDLKQAEDNLEATLNGIATALAAVCKILGLPV